MRKLNEEEVGDLRYCVDEVMTLARQQLRHDHAKSVVLMRALIEKFLDRRFDRIEAMEAATQRMFGDYRKMIMEGK